MNLISRVRHEFGGNQKWKWGIPVGLITIGVVIGFFLVLLYFGIVAVYCHGLPNMDHVFDWR